MLNKYLEYLIPLKSFNISYFLFKNIDIIRKIYSLYLFFFFMFLSNLFDWMFQHVPPPSPGGRYMLEIFAYTSHPPSFKNKILISNWLKKLCYLDNTIISYSNFFTYFNVISWINYVYYFYITNLMFNFCNNSLHVISLMSLMFTSFL